MVGDGIFLYSGVEGEHDVGSFARETLIAKPKPILFLNRDVNPGTFNS